MIVSLLDALLGALPGARKKPQAMANHHRVWDFRAQGDGHWAQAEDQTGPYVRIRGVCMQGCPRPGDIVWMPSEIYPKGRRLPVVRVERARPGGAFTILALLDPVPTSG